MSPTTMSPKYYPYYIYGSRQGWFNKGQFLIDTLFNPTTHVPFYMAFVFIYFFPLFSSCFLFPLCLYLLPFQTDSLTAVTFAVVSLLPVTLSYFLSVLLRPQLEI